MNSIKNNRIFLLYILICALISCNQSFVTLRFKVDIDTTKSSFCLCKKNDNLCKQLKRSIPYLKKYDFIKAEILFTDGKNNIIVINEADLNYVKRYIAYQINDEYIIVKNDYNLEDHYTAFLEFEKNVDSQILFDQKVWNKIVLFLGWRVEKSHLNKIIW